MKAIITKDNIILENNNLLNSKSINYYEVICEFDTTWNNLTKEAIIVKQNATIGENIAITPENKFYIDRQYNGYYSLGFIGYILEYNLTTDTAIDINKTYYTRSGSAGSYVYTKVANPVVSELNTYYEAIKTYQISTNLVPFYIQLGAGEIITSDIPIAITANQWQVYIAQIQSILTGIDNLNITASKTGTVTTITITNKQGISTSVQINDGQPGVSTYAGLPDKPQINNVTLSGNKSLAELGINIPTKTSDLTNDSGYITNSYHDKAKVDKVDGKALSTNDYDNTEKSNVASNTSARHTHSNKSLLDTYTQTEINLADAVAKKHEHSNKTILDDTTASFTTADKTKLAGLSNYDDTEVRGLIAGKQDVMQYSTMPTASASNVDKIVQFVGTTDSNYTNGYFYKNIHTQVAESITATQTDNVVPLGTITLDNNTLKSQLNAGTHEFVYRPYDTVLNFMNLTAFPPVSYQVTRDSTFDRQPMIPNAPKLYSWVDNNNNFYATDTLQPNALTKLYTLDIQTNDLTDTGATFISSNTPSQIEGRWTKKEGDVYTDVEISDYGILLSSAGLPGNTIQVNYTPTNDSYNWTRVDVQPAGSGGASWGSITGTLSNQTDLNTALGNKVNVEQGKGLSTNDYTTAEKNKLAGIDMSIKQNVTDNTLQTTNKTVPLAINEVNSIAKQANKAEGYNNYSALITMLNSASASAYNAGQSFLIQTQDVPDLWIISIEQTSVPYTYTTDSAFVTATSQAGGQQVGYYKLGQLETLKQDLTNYLDNTRIDTAISSSSTNSQVASAKSVYDYIQSLDGTNIDY